MQVKYFKRIISHFRILKPTFLGLLLCNFVLGGGIPFSVTPGEIPGPPSGVVKPEDADTQSTTISDLKYQAVVEWLQSYLGPRYGNFDKYVTPEFAEKYILDYRVNRNAKNSTAIELVGHLDGDSLKRWIRLVESKLKGSNQIRPLLVISSNLPGFTMSAEETSVRVRDQWPAQLISTLLNQSFAKLNTRVSPIEGSFGLSTPPKNDSELRSLRSAANRGSENTAIWVALTSCSSCGGGRIDIFFYSLPTLRLVSAVGDDLTINPRELGNTESFKRLLAPIFLSFSTELENSVSDGRLFDNAYHLLFENVESYRLLKVIEAELNRSDYLSNPVFKRAESKAAEFEVLTSLSIEELSRRIQTLEVSGRRPKLTRTDNTTLVLRF